MPSKKRKLDSGCSNGTAFKRARALTTTTTVTTTTTATRRESILALEEAIVESPKHYNNIVTLLAYLKDSLDAAAVDPQLAVTAAVALCRTFCRLMAKDRLLLLPGDGRRSRGDDEWAVAAWLRERYDDYTALLRQALAHDNGGVQKTALTLLMRLIKDEAVLLRPAGHTCYFFPNESFAAVVRAIVVAPSPSSSPSSGEARREWVANYVDVYDDVRYSFFAAIK